MSDATGFLAEPPASAAATAAYEEDLASDGYVNNLTRLWCWRPDVLASFGQTRAVLADGVLSKRDTAVLVAATAAAREDSYCALAWGTRLAGLSDAQTAAGVLRGDDANLTVREAALAGWARQVVRDPNATTAADVARLRAAGLDDQAIFEATTLIAFRLAFSTVNDALGARPDAQLAAAAPPPVRASVTFGRPV